MSCLHDGLSKQDQVTDKVLGGSSRVKKKYCTAYHHTVQKQAKLAGLMAQPHHTSTAHTRLHSSLCFHCCPTQYFFQTKTILKIALS